MSSRDCEQVFRLIGGAPDNRGKIGGYSFHTFLAGVGAGKQHKAIYDLRSSLGLFDDFVQRLEVLPSRTIAFLGRNFCGRPD